MTTVKEIAPMLDGREDLRYIHVACVTLLQIILFVYFCCVRLLPRNINILLSSNPLFH
jgi:hypothetical protein